MTTDDADEFRAELDGQLRFRRQQNILSFLAFFLSLAIGFAGITLSRMARNPLTAAPFLPTAAALSVFAFMCYCRYKGRSVLFAFACFAGCFALLLLAVLKDMRYERILELERELRRRPVPAE